MYFSTRSWTEYFREGNQRYDIREFRALRRRLNFLQQEIYGFDSLWADSRDDAKADEKWVRNNEILVRNYVDEAAEIRFVLGYFEELGRSWPRHYYWALGLLIAASMVLSIMAILN